MNDETLKESPPDTVSSSPSPFLTLIRDSIQTLPLEDEARVRLSESPHLKINYATPPKSQPDHK